MTSNLSGQCESQGVNNPSCAPGAVKYEAKIILPIKEFSNEAHDSPMSAYVPENPPIEEQKVLILFIQMFNSARHAHQNQINPFNYATPVYFPRKRK